MTKTPPPTSAHHVSEEEREFFYQVGNAITEWANIDEILFNIFSQSIKTSKQHAAILYYRNNTISARLSLVAEILFTLFAPSQKIKGIYTDKTTQEWVVISAKMNDLIPIRNQLAHSPVGPRVEINQKPDGKVAITDMWWSSYMSRNEKLRKESAEELKTADVSGHVLAVSDLWMSLRNFETMLLPPLLK